MIYFAELFMTGGQHAAFNGAMLAALGKAFPEEEITLFAGKSHYEQLQVKENTSSLHYRPVQVNANKSGSSWQWLLKFLNEWIQIVRVLIQGRKKSVHFICFAFLSPLGQWFVSHYARYWGYKEQQILIILHGLDILDPKGTRKRIDQIYAKLLKKAFARPAKNKRYIVLEERVADYLVQQAYLQTSELISIAHPYRFKTLHATRADQPLIFAHLGVARLAKNSQLFFELAKRFAAQIENGEILFQVIGPVLPELAPHLNRWVRYVNQENFMSESDYRRSCEQAHYALFFYDEANYALTSSGAVMDAIAYRLPILALNSPVFDALQSVSPSFPGALYTDVEQMYVGISEVIKHHQAMHRHFDVAFLTLQQHYSVDHVAMQLAGQLINKTRIS